MIVARFGHVLVSLLLVLLFGTAVMAALELFEEFVGGVFAGPLPFFVHLSLGQEAGGGLAIAIVILRSSRVIVGVDLQLLSTQDVLTPQRRIGDLSLVHSVTGPSWLALLNPRTIVECSDLGR